MSTITSVNNNGQILKLKIRITNNGTDPNTNMEVTGAIPSGLSYTNSIVPSGTTFDYTVAKWTVPVLAVGETKELEVYLIVDDITQAPFTWTLVAIGDNTDPAAGNNTIVFEINSTEPYPSVMVDIVEDIEQVSGVSEGDIIGVRGFYAVGDSGQPWFYEVFDLEPIGFPEDGVITVGTDNGKFAVLMKTASMPVEWFGAKGDNTTDDTAAVEKGMTYNNTLEFMGDRVYRLAELEVTSGVTLFGNGATLFQLDNLGAGKRMIQVLGSNVVIDGFNLVGNISTDTGEQNHSIYIYPSNSSISNIEVRNCTASDVRGDFVYIGSPNVLYNVSGVRVINSNTNNLFRNSVSVSHGSDILVDTLLSDDVGFTTVDVEPFEDWHVCENIAIKNVVGNVLSAVSANPNSTVSNITIDGARLTNTLHGASESIGTTVDSAIQLRNASNVLIKNVDIDTHDHYALEIFKEVGDNYTTNVVLDGFEIKNCYQNEVVGRFTYVRYGNNVRGLEIKNGHATVEANISFVNGGAGDSYREYDKVVLKNIRLDGAGSLCRNNNVIGYDLYIDVDNYCMTSMQPRTEFYNCTFDGDRIAGGNASNIFFKNCILTYVASKYYGTGDAREVDCVDDGNDISRLILIGDSTGDNDDIILDITGGNTGGTAIIDGQRLVVTNRGYLGSGFPAGEEPDIPFHFRSEVSGEFEETSFGNNTFELLSVTELNPDGGRILSFKRATGDGLDRSVMSIVSANDVIGTVSFNAYDGDNFDEVANIKAVAVGTPADDAIEGEIQFYVNDALGSLNKVATLASDDSSAFHEVVTFEDQVNVREKLIVGGDLTDYVDIDNDGSTTDINSVNNKPLRLQVNGSTILELDSLTGSATIDDVLKLVPRAAAPGIASEGMIYANSSDNHLYYYNGSSWVQLDN